MPNTDWQTHGVSGRDTLREACEHALWLYHHRDPARPNLRWRGLVRPMLAYHAGPNGETALVYQVWSQVRTLDA